jgi:hypothetical protein
VYFYRYFVGKGASPVAAGTLSGLTGFAVIGMGALGCVPGEWWAGSIGRAR